MCSTCFIVPVNNKKKVNKNRLNESKGENILWYSCPLFLSLRITESQNGRG